jgi:hypothetical protein
MRLLPLSPLAAVAGFDGGATDGVGKYLLLLLDL